MFVEAHLKTLFSRVDDCLIVDRVRLKKRLHSAKHRLRAGQACDRLLAEIEAELARSCARVAARKAHIPVPRYPEDLPVAQRRAEILKVLANHQVLVIAGETGSGKTTQLPKLCLELGRGVTGQIGHTQPRRIAARAVAERVAEELSTPLGELVGFKIRFSDKVSERTAIKVMTDGILLAEIISDPLLLNYDTLIIDEAHERSLNIDFLLGYLKQLLPRRPDLKLIITSATIDVQRFSAHFNDAPIIEVSGRTYPVVVRYRPLLAEDEEGVDRDMQQAILDAVDELSREGLGDILIFLSGEREIRETAEALRKHHPKGTEILPLYARLSASEQNRVFAPHGGRRIVLATNVAETSLTVPGIHYVIDTGLARVSRYSVATKVQRLPIEKISQASANQRAGRCGRVAAGVCIRLYDEADFNARPEFTCPEILRTNLAAVILQMLSLNLGDIEAFPFVESPEQKAVNDGFRLLEELSAIDGDRRLTALGRQLSRLSIDPRLARMLIAAGDLGCVKEMLILTSALSIADVRERPMEFQQAADEKHKRFVGDGSDFLALLKLWEYVEQKRGELSENRLRKLCRDEFLSFVRLREWRELHQQLSAQARELQLRVNQQPAEYEPLHRALLSGLLGQIGYKSAEGDYLGARNIRFHLFPASSLFRKGPKWLMAGELVETSRLYARLNARIEPEWVEAAAGSLVKRQYFEPHWEQRRAQVAAYEQISIYGLVLIEKRKINYGPIDPVLSRQLFIRHALVQGEYQSKAAFRQHNLALIDDVEDLEHKSRKRDVLVDEQVLFDFYDARIPEGIYSGPQFEQWLKKAEAEKPRLLFLTRDELMRHGAEGVTGEQYPERWHDEGWTLPLSYQFEPGHENDGVTIAVPVTLINQLDPARFDWLVPGFRQELVTALIKSLPKALRKNFVPAPDFARAVLNSITPGEATVTSQIGRELKRISAIDIPADAWDWSAVPAHLRMNFQIVGEHGKVLAQARHWQALRDKLAGKVAATVRESGETLERSGLSDWTINALPPVFEARSAGLPVRAYPALVDETSSVAVRLFDTEAQAQCQHRAGLRRLILLQCSRELKYLEKNLPGFALLASSFAPAGTRSELLTDLASAAVDDYLAAAWSVRERQSFIALTERIQKTLVADVTALASGLAETLNSWFALTKPLLLKAAGGANFETEILAQLRALVYPGFLTDFGIERIRHYPRYLKALSMRLDKRQSNPGKDAQLSAELAPWQAKLTAATKTYRAYRFWPESLQAFRWLLEELRVSLFAQGIKTAQPVSVQRIEKAWTNIGL